MIIDLKKIFKALIIADENELHSIKKYGWKKVKSIKILNKKFFIYQKNEKFLTLVHSGIGLINASATTAILLSVFTNIKVVYNFGAVGGYGENIEIYDLIIPEKFYIIDTFTPWYLDGQTPGEKQYFTNNLTDLSIKNFNIGSSNSFIFKKQKAQLFANKFQAFIFDMESAAIAQICDQNKVKFMSVKAVSDKIGENIFSKDDINLRIKKSSIIALEYLIKII
ncbi:hypothetical protein [Mesomycoplasma lagogenitalium]|uniref:Nucleoside phosphorylase domain-containing protein n=1 Tax=Mesomycoplasma lagogenitalium TaxID=171286 RepID=A0ABY8LSL4_9BACT|nr:hypothetical protein [Mesomycoplasma lagogenitalium]WGI36259.1 hypothetical protein QEG99_02150 [Mesomycoplasma lagogenitalium]